MTDAELEEAKRLCDAATPGEWSHATESRETKYERVYVGVEDGPGATVSQWSNPRDAAFIAASRQLVPRLITALESARRERDAAETARMAAVRREYSIGDRVTSLAVELFGSDSFDEDDCEDGAIEAIRTETRRLTAERDAARRQLAAVSESIAVHFESKIERRNSGMTVGPMLTCREVTSEIRSGTWHTKGGE